MDTKESARFLLVLQIRVYLFKMGRYCQQVYRSLKMTTFSPKVCIFLFKFNYFESKSMFY
jgi:hypothetical protein